MNCDEVLAAIWIKFRIDILVQVKGDILQAPVGNFRYFRSSEGDLMISGPGINETVSSTQAARIQDLIQFSINHGDSIVSLPRNLRAKKIQEMSKSFDVDAELTKVALSWAHRISGHQND